MLANQYMHGQTNTSYQDVQTGAYAEMVIGTKCNDKIDRHLCTIH